MYTAQRNDSVKVEHYEYTVLCYKEWNMQISLAAA